MRYFDNRQTERTNQLKNSFYKDFSSKKMSIDLETVVNDFEGSGNLNLFENNNLQKFEDETQNDLEKKNISLQLFKTKVNQPQFTETGKLAISIELIESLTKYQITQIYLLKVYGYPLSKGDNFLMTHSELFDNLYDINVPEGVNKRLTIKFSYATYKTTLKLLYGNSEIINNLKGGDILSDNQLLKLLQIKLSPIEKLFFKEASNADGSIAQKTSQLQSFLTDKNSFLKKHGLKKEFDVYMKSRDIHLAMRAIHWETNSYDFYATHTLFLTQEKRDQIVSNVIRKGFNNRTVLDALQLVDQANLREIASEAEYNGVLRIQNMHRTNTGEIISVAEARELLMQESISEGEIFLKNEEERLYNIYECVKEREKLKNKNDPYSLQKLRKINIKLKQLGKLADLYDDYGNLKNPDKVSEKSEITYLHTYKDQLADLFLEKYLVYESIKELYYSKLAYKGEIRNVRDISLTGRNILGQYNNTQKESARIRRVYNQVKDEFLAITRAYLLNEDLTTIDKGVWGGFFPATGEALFEKVMDIDAHTDQDLVNSFVSSLNKAGIPLSEDQKKRAALGLGQKVGIAVGESIPVMFEIALTTFLTEGLGTAPAIAKAGNTVKAVLKARYGFVRGGKLYSLYRGTLVGSTSFILAGESGTAGGAEGFTQGLLDNTLLTKLGNRSKYGQILALGVRVFSGATAETIQEYTGNFAQNIVKYGGNIDKVFKETFGRNLNEASEKLLITGITAAMFSGAFNTAQLAIIRSNIGKNVKESPEKRFVINALINAVIPGFENSKIFPRDLAADLKKMTPDTRRKLRLKVVKDDYKLSKEQKERVLKFIDADQGGGKVGLFGNNTDPAYFKALDSFIKRYHEKEQSNTLDTYLTTEAIALTELAIRRGDYMVGSGIKDLAGILGLDVLKDHVFLKGVHARVHNKYKMALKALGKVDLDINIEKFYASEESKFRFRKKLQEYVKNNKYGLNAPEVEAIFGYTSNYFYRTLNTYHREGIKQKLTQPITDLINNGLNKITDKVKGNVYRAISLPQGEVLNNFINKHIEKNEKNEAIIYPEFISAAIEKDGSFWNRPNMNVKLIIKSKTATEITPIAFGPLYEGLGAEVLFKSNTKFKVIKVNSLEGGIYEIHLEEK